MEKLYNQLRNDKSIFVWFNQEQQAQEIIIYQKKTGKPTCIVYRTGSFVLMDKSSTESRHFLTFAFLQDPTSSKRSYLFVLFEAVLGRERLDQTWLANISL